MSKQFNKKTARSSQLVLTCSVAYCNDIPHKKIFVFKIRQNMKERKWRTMYIEMKKYVHLISYKYLKNIVKIFKFENKNVKKRRIENVWSA